MKIKKIIKKLFNMMGLEIMRRNPNLALDTHLKYIISQQNIDLVIDVGANSGQFGKLMRDIGYRGKIISFEPTKKAFEKLKSNADNNWDCYKIALGNEVGSKEIKVYALDLFSSFLNKTEYGLERFQSEVSNYDTELIDITTLDKFLDGKIYNNIFLKMDTQGYDLEVFKGALNVRKNIKMLMTEVAFHKIYDGMPSYLDALSSYNKAGFQLTSIFPMNFNQDSTIVEGDAVLVRGCYD